MSGLLNRCIRAMTRDEGIKDLRLIDHRFRHLYRERFINGCTGTRLGILIHAERSGHFRMSAYEGQAYRLKRDAQLVLNRARMARGEHQERTDHGR